MGCYCLPVHCRLKKEIKRWIDMPIDGKDDTAREGGQLNLPSGGDLVTGNVNSAELTKMVRKSGDWRLF